MNRQKALSSVRKQYVEDDEGLNGSTLSKGEELGYTRIVVQGPHGPSILHTRMGCRGSSAVCSTCRKKSFTG